LAKRREENGVIALTYILYNNFSNQYLHLKLNNIRQSVVQLIPDSKLWNIYYLDVIHKKMYNRYCI